MNKSRWIWNDGDFEIYHSMLLHNRRTTNILVRDDDESRGIRPEYYNVMWKVSAPSPTLSLIKRATIDKKETIVFHTNNCDESCLRVGKQFYSEGETVTLEPGEYTVRVFAYKTHGFPSVYIEGDTFASDKSWKYFTHAKGEEYTVGYNDMYTEFSDDPEVFKFSYERIAPASCEKAKNGYLYGKQ